MAKILFVLLAAGVSFVYARPGYGAGLLHGGVGAAGLHGGLGAAGLHGGLGGAGLHGAVGGAGLYGAYDYFIPKPYAFEYGISDQYSGANFAQHEESDGKNVIGSYSVDLPDGRRQTVTYTADHIHGFQADVVYHGQAHYPSIPVYPI